MNMRQLRERAKLRTMDVAVALDVAESSVRNWERGRSVPRLEQVKCLLKLYKCSFDEFYDAITSVRKENEVPVLHPRSHP